MKVEWYLLNEVERPGMIGTETVPTYGANVPGGCLIQTYGALAFVPGVSVVNGKGSRIGYELDTMAPSSNDFERGADS